MRRRATLTLALIALLAVIAPATANALPTHGQVVHGAKRFLDRQEHGTGDRRPARIPATTAPLPTSRIVSFYGAPQMGSTVLGLNTPEQAAAKLAKQSAPYGTAGDRQVVGAFDLVSVFATAGGGPDGLYRTRQNPDVISIYLDQARAVGARLMLDIQPGRSSFLAELRELRAWVVQPDVDIALDPEWNVGRHGVPGQTPGSVSGRKVNRVARKLEAIAKAHDLPPKLLVVHQFRRGSIRGKRRIARLDRVQTVLNYDGIGSPGAKQAGYAALASPKLFNGFSLFYRRDKPLMSPPTVLALYPAPDFLLYQ